MQSIYPSWAKRFMKDKEKIRLKKKKGNKGPEQGLESFGCYSAVCISLPDDLQENSFLRRALKNPHNLHENSREKIRLKKKRKKGAKDQNKV